MEQGGPQEAGAVKRLPKASTLLACGPKLFSDGAHTGRTFGDYLGQQLPGVEAILDCTQESRCTTKVVSLQLQPCENQVIVQRVKMVCSLAVQTQIATKELLC